jgi:glutamyl-tRNA reductase
MRSSAAEATTVELDRLERRLDAMDSSTRQEVAHSIRRIVDKMLHLPTVRARQLASTPEGAVYVDALGKLFAPEDRAVSAEEVMA